MAVRFPLFLFLSSFWRYFSFSMLRLNTIASSANWMYDDGWDVQWGYCFNFLCPLHTPNMTMLLCYLPFKQWGDNGE